MKRLLIAMCLVVAMAATVFAKPLTMEQVLDGTCKVSCQAYPGAKWSSGTGTCIAEDKEKWWFLTNGHVIEGARAVKLYLFRNGYRSKGFTGTIEWKNYKRGTNVDIALVSIKKTDVKYFKPRVIPLADEDEEIKRDRFFQTGTCPMGLDALVRQGRVYADQNWRFYISEVLPGQSGSGILFNVADKKGELHTKLVGVITWRIAIPSGNSKTVVGGVIPIKVIRTVMAGKPYNAHPIPSNFMYCNTQNINWPANADTLCSPDGRPFLDAYVLGANGCFYLKNLDGSVNVPMGTEIQCWRLRNLWQRRPGIIIPKQNTPRWQQPPYYRQPQRPLVPVQPRGISPAPSPCDPPGPMPTPGIPTPELIPIPDDGPKPTPAPPRPDPRLPAPINPAPIPLPEELDPSPEPEEDPEPEPEDLPPFVDPNLEAELRKALEARDKALELVQKHKVLLKLLADELRSLAEKYNNSLEWKDKYDKAHADLMEARKSYDILVGDLNSAQAAIVDLEKLSERQKQAMNKVVDEAQKVVVTNNNLRIENQTTKNHRNVATTLLGLLGFGVLSYVGRVWYRKRGKAKIDKLQGGAAALADKVGLDGGAVRESLERFELRIIELFDKKFPEQKPTPPPLPIRQPENVEVVPPPQLHPDYRQPPPPIDPPPQGYVPVYYAPQEGLGPVPPEYPGRVYSATQVLNAVDEVAKRHPDDNILGIVPQLVRQIMDEPQRTKHKG